jgi:hypothetical protein
VLVNLLAVLGEPGRLGLEVSSFLLLLDIGGQHRTTTATRLGGGGGGGGWSTNKALPSSRYTD